MRRRERGTYVRTYACALRVGRLRRDTFFLCGTVWDGTRIYRSLATTDEFTIDRVCKNGRTDMVAESGFGPGWIPSR